MKVLLLLLPLLALATSAPVHEEFPDLPAEVMLDLDFIKELVKMIAKLGQAAVEKWLKEQGIPIDQIKDIINAIGKREVSDGEAKMYQDVILHEADVMLDLNFIKELVKMIAKLGQAAVEKWLKEQGIPVDQIKDIINAIGKREVSDGEAKMYQDVILREADVMLDLNFIKELVKMIAKLGQAAVEKWLKEQGIPVDQIKDIINAIGSIGKREVSDAEAQMYQDMIVRDLTSDIEEIAAGIIEKYIAKLQELISQGKEKYAAILEKAKQLVKDLHDHSQGALAAFKRFMDELAKIIGSTPLTNREIDMMVDHFVEEVHTEFEQRLAVRRRGLQDIKDKIMEHLNKLIDHIMGKYHELKQFLKDYIKETQDHLQPHLDDIKQLAKQFLEHAHEASQKVKQEALEFFEQHKQDLGELWDKIVSAAGSIVVPY